MFEDFGKPLSYKWFVLVEYSVTLTLVPRDHQACAISHPTAPSPIIASELGALLAPVAFLFVHGCASVNPFIFGIVALLPVDNTTACFATNVLVLLLPSLLELMITRLGPLSCPWPRTMTTPPFSSVPFTLLSSHWSANLSRLERTDSALRRP